MIGHVARLLAATALLVAGCAAPAIPSAPATTAASAKPTASVEPVGLQCAGRLNAQSVDVTTAAELERAAIFRREMGFPSDDALVREMACRIDANLEDVPLTVEELRELERRTRVGHAIDEIVQPYAKQHQSEFGGLYIDQSRGGVVIILWTANLPEHEVAIRALLDPDAPIALRQVRWSEGELRQLQDRITADRDWFSQVQAALQTTNVDTRGNVVEIGISSANPDAPGLIVAHYGPPPGMIRVVSDGTGAALLPWATVKGVVVGRDGRPPGQNEFMVQERPGGPPGSCGGEDAVGFGVQPSGDFEYPCQVGVRIIEVIDMGSALPHPVIGAARVDVPAGGVVFVRIEIDPPGQP